MPERGVETDTPATTGQELGYPKACKSQKGDSIPKESSRRLQILLPIAAVNVLQRCFQIFQRGFVHIPKDFGKDICIW